MEWYVRAGEKAQDLAKALEGRVVTADGGAAVLTGPMTKKALLEQLDGETFFLPVLA